MMVALRGRSLSLQRDSGVKVWLRPISAAVA